MGLQAARRSLQKHGDACGPLTYNPVCEVDLLRIVASRGNDPVLKQHVLLGGGAGRTSYVRVNDQTHLLTLTEKAPTPNCLCVQHKAGDQYLHATTST